MKNRSELIERIVDYRSEEADIDFLIEFFRENQINYLESLTDKELEGHVSDFGLDFLLDDE